jgi:hypothetical protein
MHNVHEPGGAHRFSRLTCSENSRKRLDSEEWNNLANSGAGYVENLSASSIWWGREFNDQERTQ